MHPETRPQPWDFILPVLPITSSPQAFLKTSHPCFWQDALFLHHCFCFSLIKVISNLKSPIDLWNLLLETVPFPLFHHQKQKFSTFWASQVAQMVKNPPASAGDTGDPGLILGSGRSPGGGNGNPLHYCCLENPTDRVAWWATVHGVAKSRTWLSSEHFHAFNFSVCYFGIYLQIWSL